MNFDFSLVIVPIFVLLVVAYGLVRRVNVYDEFIEGAKGGLRVVLKVLPFVVGMIFAVDIFRASGCFEALSRLIAPLTGAIGIPSEIMQLSLMRPFSGGASIAVLVSIFAAHGADSYLGRSASTMMGSSETMFYTIALYCGSVGVTKTRYIVPVGIFTDIVGIYASLWICDVWFP